LADPGFAEGEGNHGERVEREPKWGAPSGVQGQSPWWGAPEAETFLHFYAKKLAKN